jgi:hypothetical protein
MVKIIFACLLLALDLWGCDSGGGGGTCVDLAEDPSFVFDFSDCPTDGLKQVCNRYECSKEGDLVATVRPRGCKPQDCFIMGCNSVMQGDSTFGGGFIVDAVSEDSSFVTRLTVKDVLYGAICSPILDELAP